MNATCMQMAEAHSENSANPWYLNNSQIFNHLDSFVQRCYDMIEVCECMITFGRLDETEHIPKPMFGTSKGKIYEAMCEKAEKLFFEAIEDIERVHLFTGCFHLLCTYLNILYIFR